mmetsp:Transcript_25392/g.31288  ORF Transcript_25392/g.31288 Transcript_25392/m.31288 type:complete len:96 (-) Transcript_25392:51-338(-)
MKFYGDYSNVSLYLTPLSRRNSNLFIQTCNCQLSFKIFYMTSLSSTKEVASRLFTLGGHLPSLIMEASNVAEPIFDTTAIQVPCKIIEPAYNRIA